MCSNDFIWAALTPPFSTSVSLVVLFGRATVVVAVVFAGVEDGGIPTVDGVGRRCWGCADDDDVVVGMATSVDGVGRF